MAPPKTEILTMFKMIEGLNEFSGGGGGGGGGDGGLRAAARAIDTGRAPSAARRRPLRPGALAAAGAPAGAAISRTRGGGFSLRLPGGRARGFRTQSAAIRAARAAGG